MIINYYKIVPVIDILGFLVSIFTFFRSCKNILINKDPIISFTNLPFISLLISVSFVLDFMGIILDKKDFFFISKLISGAMICYVLILERFFPSLFGKVKVSGANIDKEIESETIPTPEVKETKKYKYPPRDLLEGTDLEKVKIKLSQFITSKGFIDEELRLPDFASDLGLSTHQASYYLNKYLSQSYNDFLNFHRINEVMIMMKNKSNFNLLNIALECGFNSASSFHRACIKFTGKSPRDLRNELLSNIETSNKAEKQSDL
ncbi:helix-turn-helix domain-containing protein [Leptospira weilii]|uniref:helix-turn-helix domain-containing protein n=1 Tax=Leptospira weilii TaxID=28184 RepID=UPI0007735D4D|nr:AraC family transcriptional regulator [Leptospira weilii]